MGSRLISLGLLIAAWYLGSQLAGARLLPDPQAVATAMLDEARSGALAFNLGATLARVIVAFLIAMLVGSVIGFVMGRWQIADRLGDPWLIVLLNLPALVIIVLPISGRGSPKPLQSQRWRSTSFRSRPSRCVKARAR